MPSNCNKHSFRITENLAETFPSEDYLPQVMSENFGKLDMAVAMFSKSEAEKKPTFALWLNYIQMAEVLLMFLRATRENNWDLHFSAVRSMLPWFFATERMEKLVQIQDLYPWSILSDGGTHSLRSAKHLA